MPANVLMIDPDPNQLRSLYFVLLKAGYLTVPIQQADEALERLSSGAFDLVILDPALPWGRGLRLLEQIVCRCPNLRVMLLTTQISSERLEEAAALGVKDCLIKPISPEQILKKIAQLAGSPSSPSSSS